MLVHVCVCVCVFVCVCARALALPGIAGEYAMHKFAYYICFKCQQPYFGGQRSCEVAAGVGEERAFVKEEMICGGCSSMGQVVD